MLAIGEAQVTKFSKAASPEGVKIVYVTPVIFNVKIVPGVKYLEKV